MNNPNKRKSFLFPFWLLATVCLVYTFFTLVIAATQTFEDSSLLLLIFMAGISILLIFETGFYWRNRYKEYPRRWASAHAWLVITCCIILPALQVVLVTILPPYLSVEQNYWYNKIVVTGFRYYYWPLLAIAHIPFIQLFIYLKKKSNEPATEEELQY